MSPIPQEPSSDEVLDCPMIAGNDADAATVREFLLALLSTLWVEGEGFSSKRPLGNSDWYHQVMRSMEAKYGDRPYEVFGDWVDKAITTLR